MAVTGLGALPMADHAITLKGPITKVEQQFQRRIAKALTGGHVIPWASVVQLECVLRAR